MNKLLTALLSIGLITGGLFAGLLLVNLAFPESLATKETSVAQTNGLIDTYFCAEFKAAGTDEWVDLGCRHNVFTDVGREHVEGLLGGRNIGGEHVKYLALGNGSAPTSGSTTLNAEQTLCGLGRQNGDFYDLGTGWWEVNKTFTFSCDTTLLVNTTASFNETSGGTLFAGGTISDVTFSTNGDQLRLRHNNTISEA